MQHHGHALYEFSEMADFTLFDPTDIVIKVEMEHQGSATLACGESDEWCEPGTKLILDKLNDIVILLEQIRHHLGKVAEQIDLDVLGQGGLGCNFLLGVLRDQTV